MSADVYVLAGDRVLLPASNTVGTITTVYLDQARVEVALPNGVFKFFDLAALTWRPTPGLSFAERFRLGCWLAAS